MAVFSAKGEVGIGESKRKFPLIKLNIIEDKAAVGSICSLNDPIISTVLGRLHGEASRQLGGLARLFALALADAVLRRRISSAEEARRLKHMYVST